MQFHWLLLGVVALPLGVIMSVPLMSNADITILTTVVTMPIARTVLFHMLAAF